jgi:hypothetical protein
MKSAILKNLASFEGGQAFIEESQYFSKDANI